MGRNRYQTKNIIMNELKKFEVQSNCSPQQKVQSLVKQAEYYTSFLLSNLQNSQKGQYDGQNQIFTRLTEQPSNLKGGQLKYYQLVSLNWMVNLYESGINGILADDMGLGKTIQTISMLAFLSQQKNIEGPHLIIAPKVTLGNWISEFTKWLPSLKTLKLEATKEQREIGLNKIAQRDFDVVVTSYEGIRSAIKQLKKVNWHYLVIDEAHKIKNEESDLSQKVRLLHCECKLLLTGTPLQNNLHQLWSLMNFILPEIFTSSDPFDNWIASSDEQKMEAEKKNSQMVAQLHKILKPFMLRRTKSEVQKTLPGKKEVHVFVGLTELQLKLYRNLLQKRSPGEDDKKTYLNLLMQLRKVCCHPYLFPEIEAQSDPCFGEHIVNTSGKLIVLDRLLAKIYAEGDHKVLLFSQMTSLLDILQDYCKLRGYPYCRIDGSSSLESRETQIEAFNQTNQHFIFLLSTRAGGLGINLTAADTVVLYDSDFNPQMDLQAMDRAYRIGQKKFVRVYRLITENTVEQKIIERQMIKLKWDRLIIQQQRSTQKNKNMTKGEMKQILQYGASTIFKATSNTLSEDVIEDLLSRGQQRTNVMNQQLEKEMKVPQDLSNLNMDSINIFDFMQRDQQRKLKDRQTLEENVLKEQLVSVEPMRRLKFQAPKIKVHKRVTLPEHHFYEDKQQLLELLQKEEDHKNNKHFADCPPLTQEENYQKQKLLSKGFRNWNKSDFQTFVSANEKYGRKNIVDIAKALKRSVEEVEAYSKAFWNNVDSLQESERIMKFIESGENKQQNQRHFQSLLEWKINRFGTIEPVSSVYTKFRSKLYSVDADIFIQEKLLEHGSTNTSKVREILRNESIFRFDHYLRTRNESDIKKRVSSLCRLLEKQKQYDANTAGKGLERQNFKRTYSQMQEQQPEQQYKPKKKKASRHL